MIFSPDFLLSSVFFFFDYADFPFFRFAGAMLRVLLAQPARPSPKPPAMLSMPVRRRGASRRMQRRRRRDARYGAIFHEPSSIRTRW